jgi:hypothetical protein
MTSKTVPCKAEATVSAFEYSNRHTMQMSWSSGLHIQAKPLKKGNPDQRFIANLPVGNSRPIRSLDGRKYFYFNLAVRLVLVFAALSGSAQVVPSLRTGPNISAFTTFTAAKPDYKYYGDLAVYGVSIGGIIQRPHLFGVEVRGSLLRSGGLEHQESALTGPHVAIHLGRIAPYVSVLGGYGNAWWWSNPPLKGDPKPKLMEGLGPEWSVLGGIDVHLNPRVNFRIGELAYSQTYVKGRTVTPLNASAGMVFRIH